MKRKQFFLISLLMLAITAMVFNACKKDDEPKDLTLETLVAGAIDLNAAVSPTNVPINPTIVATFSTDVDPTTATAANIELISNYDNAVIPLTITISDNIITVVPTEILGTGTLFDLKFKSGLKSSEGEFLAEVSRNFTTEGSFAPAGVIAHWTFEDNADDVAGSYDPAAGGIVDISYVASRNAAAGKAASFNGTTSIIEIPNGDQLMNTNDFTLSFWAKAQESGRGHFIIGLAAFFGFQFELNAEFLSFKMPLQLDFGDGTSGTAGDLVFNGDGKTKDNDGWRGTVFSKENTDLPGVLRDKWFHITYVFNSSLKTRSFFLNGELAKRDDFNLWLDDEGEPWPETGVVGLKYAGTEPETYPELAFGFIQSRAGTLWANEPWGGYQFPDANHFKGQLDDVRIYHKVLSEAEILLMYNSEKP
jgi:hypothetical protein